jgi:flagellar biosynthetic protein FliO
VPESPLSPLSQAASVFFALIVVVGAIFLIYWASKFFLSRGGLMNGRFVKIVDRVPVGKDKFLLLVEIKGVTYFVGVAENNITLLEKMTDDFGAETVLPPEMPFKTLLQGLTGKTARKERESELKK